MDQQLTLRVRPGETIRLPNRCLVCGRLPQEHLTLKKRHGQVSRKVEAPLCSDCARQLTRRSSEEERRLRAVRVATVIIGLIILLILAMADWGPLWLRLAVAFIAAFTVAALAHHSGMRWVSKAKLPEKRAVLNAAQITDFSWRDMTLVFDNPAIFNEVRELNSEIVVDSQPVDV
jgi:hypothetical protein